jgi:hypothetical protein
VNQIMTNQMMSNTFQTNTFQGNFSGDINAYHRIISFPKTYFEIIKDSTLYWGDDMQYGYLGFKPVKAAMQQDQQYNFL